MIVNIRSLLKAFDIPSAAHLPLYIAAFTVAVLAIGWSVRSHLRTRGQETPVADQVGEGATEGDAVVA